MLTKPDKTMIAGDALAMLNLPQTVKVLGILDESGLPRLSGAEVFSINEGRTLLLGEPLEKTESNRGMVRAIWADTPVSIYLADSERAFDIRARVWRCHITGEAYDAVFSCLRAKYGDHTELAAVWELIPESCFDISPQALRARQRALYPLYSVHLDNPEMLR